MSVSYYFYLKEGKVTGPVTKDDVESLLSKSELTSIDLMYNQDEKKWKAIGEFSEFGSIGLIEEAALQSEIGEMVAEEKERAEKKIKATKRPQNIGGWVVLRTKPGFSSQYEQIGPYSKTELEEMLASGAIGFQDYVWTDGYKDWSLLAQDENFQASLVKTGRALPQPPASVDEILDKRTIDELNAQRIGEEVGKPVELGGVPPTAEARPADAEGPDLAGGESGSDEANSSKVMKVEAGESRNAASGLTSPSIPNNDLEEEPSPVGSHRWIGLVAVFLVAGISVYLLLVSRVQRPSLAEATHDNVEKVQPQVKVSEKPVLAPATTVRSKAPPRAATKKVKELKIAPRYMKIAFRRLKSDRGEIEVKSDASRHFLAKVEITGSAGQTLYSRGHYSRTFTIPLVKKKRVLSLSKVGLPSGNYTYRVRLGEKNKAGKFSWGVRNKVYSRSLYRLRKNLSPAHQQEKTRLAGNVQSLITALDGLAVAKGVATNASRSKARRKISKLSRQLGRSMRGRLLWPETWAEIRLATMDWKAMLSKASSAAEVKKSQAKARQFARKVSALSVF